MFHISRECFQLLNIFTMLKCDTGRASADLTELHDELFAHFSIVPQQQPVQTLNNSKHSPLYLIPSHDMTDFAALIVPSPRYTF